MQVGLSLALTRGGRSAGVAGAVGALVFGNAPFQLPTNNTIFAPSASQLTGIQDEYLPPQPAGWRLVLANFQMGAAGLTSPEILPGNTNTIDYVSLFSAAGGSGFVSQVTFGGSDSVTLADGGYAISDAMPAWAGGYLRTSITTASGANRPRGYTTRLAASPSPIAGEVGRTFTGPQASFKATGALTGGTATAAGNSFAPAAVLVPRTTQNALLGVGNWLMTGTDEDWRVFSSSTGMWGAFARAFDDAGSTQMGFGNFGQRGALGVNTSADALGNFGCRLALLNAVKSLGGGWPFTAVISQYLPQDFAGMTTPTLQDLKDRAQLIWNYLNAKFSRPIVQTTVAMPTTSPNTFWTDYADQTVSLDVDAFNTWLIDNLPTPLALVIDTRTTLRTKNSGAWKWTPTAWTTAGGGLLTVAAPSGTNLNTTGLTLSASTPPQVGEFIVVETGANGEISNQAIAVVTDLGSGVYNIKVAASATLSKSHVIGAQVLSSDTRDGVTPGPALTQRLALVLEAAKANIPFLNVPVAGASSRQMIAATRLRPAVKRTQVASSAEVHGAHRVNMGSPPRPLRNAVWAWTRWSVQPGSGTGDPGELAAGSSVKINGAAVEIGGVYYPLTFNGGSTTATLADDGTLKNDPFTVVIPPNTSYRITTLDEVQVGDYRLGSFTAQPQNSEGMELGSSALTAYLTGGSMPTNTASLAQDAVWGPTLCTGEWWDGVEPVRLLLHDSQGEFNDMALAADGRGNLGPMRRGYDDFATRRQMAWSCGNGGARLDDWSMGGDIGFGRRRALLESFSIPFSEITNQISTNNIPVESNLAAFQAKYAAFKAYHQGWAGALPWTQLNILPRADRNTANNNSYGWTDEAHQDVALTYVSVSLRTDVNAWFATKPLGMKKLVDVAAQACGVDPTKVRTTGFSTTLNTAVTAGGATSVILDALPDPWTALVFEPATANVDINKPDSTAYTAGVGTGSGPYTVPVYLGRTGNQQAVIKAHAAGSTVKTAETQTGLHFQTPSIIRQASAVAASKA